ncbi:Protein prenyltransferase alpha subunit repeat-containing protein 1 [Chytridiales sp. JEL 0842]|nr:Protein prenyltransferase alpha subunit repeat-containing protein 1 [Chytridiales sp. JEL 0842]
MSSREDALLEMFAPYQILIDLLHAHPPSTLKEMDIVHSLLIDPSSAFAPFVLVDGYLGVPGNIVPLLYKKASMVFFGYKSVIRDMDALSKLAVDDVDQLCHSSRVLLLINPENYTAWNLRKRLITLGKITLEYDLSLMDLILTKHPKRAGAWSHRYWLLVRLVEDVTQNSDDSLNGIMDKRLRHELSICTMASEKHRMNYHSWTYRGRLRDMLSKEIIHEELDAARKWIRSHVSDHCGYMYHISLMNHLISRLGDDTNTKDVDASSDRKEWRSSLNEYIQLLQSEVTFSFNVIADYPGHESAWCHLRGMWWICHNLIKKQEVSAAISEEEALYYLMASAQSDQISQRYSWNPSPGHIPSAQDFLVFAQWYSGLVANDSEQLKLPLVFQFHLISSMDVERETDDEELETPLISKRQRMMKGAVDEMQIEPPLDKPQNHQGTMGTASIFETIQQERPLMALWRMTTVPPHQLPDELVLYMLDHYSLMFHSLGTSELLKDVFQLCYPTGKLADLANEEFCRKVVTALQRWIGTHRWWKDSDQKHQHHSEPPIPDHLVAGALEKSYWMHSDTLYKTIAARSFLKTFPSSALDTSGNGEDDHNQALSVLLAWLNVMQQTDVTFIDALEIVCISLTLQSTTISERDDSVGAPRNTAAEGYPTASSLGEHQKDGLMKALLSLADPQFTNLNAQDSNLVASALFYLHPWILSVLSSIYVEFFAAYVGRLSAWTRREFLRLRAAIASSLSVPDSLQRDGTNTPVAATYPMACGIDEDLLGIDWCPILNSPIEDTSVDQTRGWSTCSSLKRLRELVERWGTLMAVGGAESPMRTLTFAVLQEERTWVFDEVEVFERPFVEQRQRWEQMEKVKLEKVVVGPDLKRSTRDGDEDEEDVFEWHGLRRIWMRFFYDLGFHYDKQ